MTDEAIAGSPGTQGRAASKDGSGGVGGVGGTGGKGEQGEQGEPGSVRRLGLMLVGFAAVFGVLLIGIGFGLWQQTRATDAANKAVLVAQANAREFAKAARAVCEAREQQIKVIAASAASLAEAERLDGRPEIRQRRIDAYEAEAADLLKTRVDCGKLLPTKGPRP